MPVRSDSILLLIILNKLSNSHVLCDLFTKVNQRLEVQKKKWNFKKYLFIAKRVLNPVTNHRIKWIIYNWDLKHVY